MTITTYQNNETLRILVFRIGHLGDTIIALPAFWQIRNQFPNAEIDLLSNVNAQNSNYVIARQVLPKKGLFDNYLEYPTETKLREMPFVFLKLLGQIRQRKYDAVFYLMTRNRTREQIKRDRRFFKLGGIKKVIGTEFLSQNLLDFNRQRPLPIVKAESRFLQQLLENEGVYAHSINFQELLSLESEEISKADNWLEKYCQGDYQKKNLLGIAPGSKWESKIWAEEKYAEVVARMIVERNVFPVIFGGKEDREKGERLIEGWGKGANAAGELGIREAAAALEKCRLYLGNDTGTMHLAAAVGTPCIAIFSAVDWAGRWYPFGENHQVFRKSVECEGCSSPNCINNFKCLTLISEDEVFAKCLSVWDEFKPK